MKKLLILVVCVLVSFLILVQAQQGIHELGKGIENTEIKESG